MQVLNALAEGVATAGEHGMLLLGPLLVVLAVWLISLVAYCFFAAIGLYYGVPASSCWIGLASFGVWLLFNIFWNFYWSVTTPPGCPPVSLPPAVVGRTTRQSDLIHALPTSMRARVLLAAKLLIDRRSIGGRATVVLPSDRSSLDAEGGVRDPVLVLLGAPEGLEVLRQMRAVLGMQQAGGRGDAAKLQGGAKAATAAVAVAGGTTAAPAAPAAATGPSRAADDRPGAMHQAGGPHARLTPAASREQELERLRNAKPRDGGDFTCWCEHCDSFKPPRCHHDHVTDSCVLRFDHFCVWMAGPVGHKNYKFFVLFLIFLTIGCLFAAAVSFLPWMALREPGDATLVMFRRYSLLPLADPAQYGISASQDCATDADAAVGFFSAAVLEVWWPHSTAPGNVVTVFGGTDATSGERLKQSYRCISASGSEVVLPLVSNLQAHRMSLTLAFVMASSIALGVGGLCIWHIILVLGNATTIEFMHNQTRAGRMRRFGAVFRNEFDLGAAANWAAVMGPQAFPLQWLLLPSSAPSPGDGVMWPTVEAGGAADTAALECWQAQMPRPAGDTLARWLSGDAGWRRGDGGGAPAARTTGGEEKEETEAQPLLCSQEVADAVQPAGAGMEVGPEELLAALESPLLAPRCKGTKFSWGQAAHDCIGMAWLGWRSLRAGLLGRDHRHTAREDD